MISGGWAKNNEVRNASLDTSFPILEKPVVGKSQVSLRCKHAFSLGIADPNHFAVRMLCCHAKIVSHVHVFEGDTNDFYFGCHSRFVVECGPVLETRILYRNPSVSLKTAAVLPLAGPGFGS